MNRFLFCGSVFVYGSYDLNYCCFIYIGGRILKLNNVIN